MRKKTKKVVVKEFYKDNNSELSRGMVHPKKYGSDDDKKKVKKSPAKGPLKKW